MSDDQHYHPNLRFQCYCPFVLVVDFEVCQLASDFSFVVDVLLIENILGKLHLGKLNIRQQVLALANRPATHLAALSGSGRATVATDAQPATNHRAA